MKRKDLINELADFLPTQPVYQGNWSLADKILSFLAYKGLDDYMWEDNDEENKAGTNTNKSSTTGATS